MKELRIKFTRNDEVKYIGHLDIMKLFERAIRRANIQVAYSKGFNPHPQIIFGLPMSVGIASMGEYADITLDEELSPGAFMNMINSTLPKGFSVVDAKEKTAKGNIMSQVDAALYEILVYSQSNNSIQIINEKVSEFLAKEVIMFLKESKGFKKYVDIRNSILELNISEMESLQGLNLNRVFYKMTIKLNVGQRANLKPLDAVSAFNEFSGIDLKVMQIKRMSLYALFEENLINPMDDKLILQLR